MTFLQRSALAHRYVFGRRLAGEVGRGASTLASANRIGDRYGSTIFGCASLKRSDRMCKIVFLVRRGSAHDARMYRRLLGGGLAFDKVISHVRIPICNDDGVVEFQSWPMIKPPDLVPRLKYDSVSVSVRVCESFLRCSMVGFVNLCQSAGCRFAIQWA